MEFWVLTIPAEAKEHARFADHCACPAAKKLRQRDQFGSSGIIR
jgi:hypothetical protein